MLKKIFQLYVDTNIYSQLEWANKGIFPYVIIIIKIMKIIVTNPIYKIFKYVFQVLLVAEGLLIVIYYTEFTDLPPMSLILNQIYNNVLRFIRNIIDNLINDEEIIQNIKNSESTSFNDKKTINNNKDTTNTNTYWRYWLISVIVIITITGIVNVYYPNIWNSYLDIGDIKDIGDKPVPDLLNPTPPSSPSSSVPSPTESSYFKDLNELTPKASSSQLPDDPSIL
jgi:hypothetical protein